MHRHDNSQRSESNLPIRSRPNEAVVLDDGRHFDVTAMIERIMAEPEDFRQIEIMLDSLAAQIRGRSKLTFHYIAAMSRADARRPLLLIEHADGLPLLLDGRHRAARSRQLGYGSSAAWLLTPEQAAAFIR
jgi:hypothetical protein